MPISRRRDATRFDGHAPILELLKRDAYAPRREPLGRVRSGHSPVRKLRPKRPRRMPRERQQVHHSACDEGPTTAGCEHDPHIGASYLLLGCLPNRPRLDEQNIR